MRLAVSSKGGLVTVIEVMVATCEKGTKNISIWDYTGSSATVEAESKVDAEECVQALYSEGHARITAEIDWDDDE